MISVIFGKKNKKSLLKQGLFKETSILINKTTHR